MSERCDNVSVVSSYGILYAEDMRKSKSVMVERCPLCNGTKRTFYCNKCLKSGHFHKSVLSKNEKNLSFSERQKILNISEEKHKDYLSRLNKALIHKEYIASKNSEKVLLESSIMHLNFKMEQYKKIISLKKIYLNEINSSNMQAIKNTNLMKAKLERIKNHLVGCPQRLDASALNLKRSKFDLMKCRQEQIRHLIHDIFLIRALPTPNNSPEATNTSCVNLLSEARNTEYIKGQWVLSNSVRNLNQVYKIIDALIPGNGHYNKQKLTNENKFHDSSENISAALCLLTQIVFNISIILDTYLPYNISLKDFHLPSTNAKLFAKCVNKLNCNVMQLCELQHVNTDTLFPGQSIINLLKILESPRLGSDEPNLSRDNEMQNSSTSEPPEMLDASSDSNDDSNAVVLDDRDWEYVPVSLPEVEMSIPGQNSTSYFSSTILQTGQTELQSTMTNLASGLVSSASHFWKGWNTSPK